ncbi:MAG: carboxylating nicotinate-nucleotide diphosphorylase [Deltaproteobacteria bacterium]|nr:carboxylating nicotinate-nucleotide diphosphorylase [Deltaproteobacteria bacterium]
MHQSIEHLIELALAEDIGAGDITTDNLIQTDKKAEAVIIAKEPIVVAGLNIAKRVFLKLDSNAIFLPLTKEGDAVEAKEYICKINAELKALLTGERTALNFLQKLSGIATNVRSYVRLLQDKKIKLLDTRKTTPGWRIAEKYAARTGGATNHRFGLFDGILIKDNHIKAAGSIAGAINIIRKKTSHFLKIEAEASDLIQVSQAVEAGADIIMLDNMKPDMIKDAVKIINKRVLIEVSGGINHSNLNEFAIPGIDFISSGALIHSARFVDISMDIC